MFRANALAFLLLSNALASFAKASDPAKIVWKFSKKTPCAFYQDGAPYKDEIKIPTCYYMLASIENPVSGFNDLPTVDAQKAQLRDVSDTVNVALKTYFKEKSRILRETEPENIPAGFNSGLRLKRLMILRKMTWEKGTAACAPFLWPRAEMPSYLTETNGYPPATWEPFMQPFHKRIDLLSQLIEEEQKKMLRKTQKRVEELLSGVKKAQLGAFPLASASAESWRALPGLRGPGDAEQALPLTLRHFVSDQKTALPPHPLPLSDKGYAERGYFNRGYEEGMRRLENDGAISYSHLMGLSHTVGDPMDKASIIIYQNGGTCAIAAQYEVLMAQGVLVTMPDLVKEAQRKGYYSEYQLKSGVIAGGTFPDNGGALLRDHGFNVHVWPLSHQKQEKELDLYLAIQKSGGAIVGVEASRLWNDPKISGGHAVYVTGEEISNKSGEVLGYYINDTETGEAARFVSKKRFDDAWRASGFELVTYTYDNAELKK